MLTCFDCVYVVLIDVCCNSQYVAGVAGHRIAQLLHFEHVFQVVFWVPGFKGEKQILQVRKRVRLEVTEEYRIVFMFEGVGETQSVES